MVKSLSTKKTQEKEDLTGEFYKMLEKKIMRNTHSPFQKKQKGCFPIIIEDQYHSVIKIKDITQK